MRHCRRPRPSGSPRESIRASTRSSPSHSTSLAPSAFDFALLIPQSETERVLETRLQSLGTPVERLTTLIAFEDGPDGVTATLRHADGAAETVRCDWLIGLRNR